MRTSYRHEASELRRDFVIGCRILTQPFFFQERDWIPIPASWSRHIQQGRTYDATEGDGLRLWESVVERLAAMPTSTLNVSRYGKPVLISPRLGQGAFRISVTSVYQRRCAITGEKTLPILDAAHIRPYGDGGQHDVTNGFLDRKSVV